MHGETIKITQMSVYLRMSDKILLQVIKVHVRMCAVSG